MAAGRSGAQAAQRPWPGGEVALVGKYVQLNDAYLSWSRPCVTPASIGMLPRPALIVRRAARNRRGRALLHGHVAVVVPGRPSAPGVDGKNPGDPAGRAKQQFRSWGSAGDAVPP